MDKIDHWHFEITGYVEAVPERMELRDSVQIIILDADTEEEAISHARAKIKRPFYRIQKVWQCNQCQKEDLSNELQLLNLKVMTKYLKQFDK